MKKIFKQSGYLYLLLAVLVTLAVQSCKKDKNNYGTGAPTITRVRTLTKDSLVSIEHRLTLDSSLTYGEHRPMPFDSTTTSGKIYTPYMIVGTNLGSATHIYVNGVEIYFNTALATDKSLIITIPTNVPFSDASTPNKLKVVTQHGTVDFDFIIEQPFPSITSVNFSAGNAGDLIVINGTTFNGLSSVKFGTTPAQIVSSTSTQATVKVPAGLTGANVLSITTTASLGGGTTSGPLASNAVSVLNNNLETFSVFPFGFSQAVYEDGFENGWGNYGWSNSPDNNNTSSVLRGTKSIKVQYAGGYDGYVFQAPGNVPLKAIKMSVYGGKGSDNKVIRVNIDYNFDNAVVAIVLKEGAWKNFIIPMTAFVKAGNAAPKTVNSIVFQEYSGNATLFYLDDVGVIQ